MIDETETFRLYGTTRREPAPRLLTAGKLTAELAGGNLRAIRHDGVEILRAISYLVRDRDWGTLEPALSDLSVVETAGRFSVTYTAQCEGPDGTVLDIAAAIEGAADGRLVFRAVARSATGFETNRCGFCILHPIVGLAGTPVSVEHVDGSTEDTSLPELIEPWQPFTDVRAITHAAQPGVRVECRMDGDTFEMEDQRNWSDASFKTYVRPLALPWPYLVAAGEDVVQQITLSVTDAHVAGDQSAPGRPVSDASAGGVIHLTAGDASGRMPGIGLVVTPEEAKATLAALALPDALRPQMLLFHLDPLAGHGPESLTDFAAVAALHAGLTTLEIAVPCLHRLDTEMAGIARWMGSAGFQPDAIMVSPAVDRQSTPPGSTFPDCPPLEEVYRAAAKAFPGMRLGGGMLSYFTELNRKRVPSAGLDFISHCTNPIVHAGDDLSVMQTLEALPFITRSVRAIYGEMPYRIGPSTIAMRQNPYGSRTMDNPAGARIAMANRDPRHAGLFAAAFATGYAIRVAEAGLETLTLSALTGPYGLFAGDGEPVAEGGRRPLSHAVELLAGLSGQAWRQFRSSRPDRVLALGVGTSGGDGVLMVNLTPDPQLIDLSGLAQGREGQIRLLDAKSLHSGDAASERWSDGHIELAAYAVGQLSF